MEADEDKDDLVINKDIAVTRESMPLSTRMHKSIHSTGSSGNNRLPLRGSEESNRVSGLSRG